MIELKLAVQDMKFTVSDETKEYLDQKMINKPLCLYLIHKEDKRFFFPTFALVDFQKLSISHIHSFSRENARIIEIQKDEGLFQSERRFNPHCSLRTGEKRFNSFVYFDDQYFYDVDYGRGRLNIVMGKDLENNMAQLKKFPSTVYPDPDDPHKFHFAASTWSGGINYYRANLGMTGIERLCSSGAPVVPHVVRKFKNHVFSSYFDFFEYTMLWSGKTMDSTADLFRHVLDVLSEKYRSKADVGDKLKKAGQRRTGTIWWDIAETQLETRLDRNFRQFLDDSFSNLDFIDQCNSFPETRFNVEKGRFAMLDLDRKTETFYETTYSRPAHFEVDEKRGHVYVSSHNFATIDRIRYLGPAAIDKFELKDGELKLLDTFTHEKGYRFTSHRIFDFEGKPYLCTFAQPNRLYLVDAEKMELIHSEDIGEDFLSGKENIGEFLNNTDTEPYALKEIEVSDDGKMLFFLDNKHLYLYDFEKRKIQDRIPYLPNDLFERRSTHIYWL